MNAPRMEIPEPDGERWIRRVGLGLVLVGAVVLVALLAVVR